MTLRSLILLMAAGCFSGVVWPAKASAQTTNWTAPPSTAGLVGEWNFDEGTGTTLGDSSGNGRNGAISAATWTPGRNGSALSFNGGGVVNLGDVDLPGALTVMTWMQTRSLARSDCASLVM